MFFITLWFFLFIFIIYLFFSSYPDNRMGMFLSYHPQACPFLKSSPLWTMRSFERSASVMLIIMLLGFFLKLCCYNSYFDHYHYMTYNYHHYMHVPHQCTYMHVPNQCTYMHVPHQYTYMHIPHQCTYRRQHESWSVFLGRYPSTLCC